MDNPRAVKLLGVLVPLLALATWEGIAILCAEQQEKISNRD
jgi:hypothetical protein